MQPANKNERAIVNQAEPASLLSTAGLPPGFVALESGIYEITDDADLSWLCQPLTVSAVFRDAFGGGRGRLVEFIDVEGVLRTVPMFDRDLETRFSNVRGELIDRGFRLARGKKAHEALTSLLREWEPNDAQISVNKLGWGDSACRAFVLADGRVLGKGRFRYAGSDAGITAGKQRSLCTWEEWRDDVASCCAGNPLLVTSVSLAFAGPLLALLEEPGGGLHLRGNSSCGKSTILEVAASVWHHPSKVGSWRATAIGLEAAARAANATLMTLDEIAEVSGKELDEAIYTLANGMGKLRSRSDGTGVAPGEWRVAILSSGEIAVAEKLSEAGRKQMAGQEMRLLDIEADARLHGAFDQLHGCADGADLSDRLKEAVLRCHGAAGPEFARRLADRAAGAEQKLQRGVGSVERNLLSRVASCDDGQVRRVVRRFAVIALAGELATKMGLTGWQPGIAIDAAAEVLEGWLESRQSRITQHRQDPVVLTRGFLSANPAGFADLDAGSGEIVPGCHGWRDDGHFYVLPLAWKLIHGSCKSDAARQLARKGLLAVGEDNRLQRKTPRRCAGHRPRAYTIRAEILNDSVPAETPTTI